MNKLKKEIVINASLARVWSIWNDVEKTPEWVDGVQESAIVSETRQGKGLIWKENCFFGVTPVEMKHHITEWVLERKLHVSTELPMGGKMERTIDFKSHPEGVKVQIDLSWDLGMASAFIDGDTVREMMAESLDNTASNWKTKAEQP